ncbi:MAG: protein phosphatase CheZ [Parvibaculaceae bacterium]
MDSDAGQEKPNDEFETILAAVRETDRGRWFLDEFARRNRTADTNELLAAIEKLNTVATGDAPATVSVLRRELQEMSSTIQQTRVAIASIKPDEAGDNRIMAATEELDAIVSATERATSEILSGAERIQEITEKLREQNADEDLCDEIEAHATGIFMACSFQDITGQRTSRVVHVLKYLEHRVNFMIELWEGEQSPAAAKLEAGGPVDTRPDAHLINGPQAEAEAPSQDDIDAVFAADAAEVTAPADKTEHPAGQAEPAAAVDLDDLQFAETSENEIAGQDDIDALFN